MVAAGIIHRAVSPGAALAGTVPGQTAVAAPRHLTVAVLMRPM